MMDHPEHYLDEIKRYEADGRSISTALGDYLLEQARHRCTICLAPLYEFHHIKPIEKKGKTEYANLIVLCPNCHTRVHKEDVPSPRQLRYYKLKLEIGTELPVIQRLSTEEKEFIKNLSSLSQEDLVLFSIDKYQVIPILNAEEARKIARKNIGFIELEASGIISTVKVQEILKANNEGYGITYSVKISSKGIKWIRYLIDSDKISLLD